MATADLGIPESCLDLSFGFDDANFSDKTLLLKIVDDATITAPRLKAIHICSLILAARSSFFRKMFSNGMLESEQKNVTIQIKTSEEEPIMDLLKYVYSNILPTTLNALLNLLVIADKYEVTSCLTDSTQALQNLPMTCESASLYLELSSTLFMSPQLQPFADAAKHFLVANFKDLEKSTEEVLKLSLPAIKALLSSDELEVTSEYVVYDVVLKWVRKHYPDWEERRGILETHLLHLIRFPFMTTRDLTDKVQTCIDIGCEVASKIVIQALAFKSESPHQKRCLAAEEGNSSASRQFVERAYKFQPINVIELALPYEQCIVYLHFKRKNLIRLFPDGLIMSEVFNLGDQILFWFVRCFFDINLQQHRFWLGLKLIGSASCLVNYEIQLKMKPSEGFSSWVKGSHTFTESENTKYIEKVLWSEFIGDDSSYFINDFLHMRAELTAKK